MSFYRAGIGRQTESDLQLPADNDCDLPTERPHGRQLTVRCQSAMLWHPSEMSLLGRIFGQTKAPATGLPDMAKNPREENSSRRSSVAGVNVSMTASVGIDLESAIPISGMTTRHAGGVREIARRHALDEHGHLETSAMLRPDPRNTGRADIAIDDVVIGWISHIANYLQGFPVGQSVPVQLFTEVLATGLRGEAWVWLSPTQPKWDWSARNRPPMTSQAKARHSQQSRDSLVGEALAGGGQRGQRFRNGMVDGKHYLQLVEPIKEAKRDGRLDDALLMCHQAIAGAEGDRDGREPAPWYTEQAAIIYRKLGQQDNEIKVLTRWLSLVPEDRRPGTRLAERLAKLTSETSR